MDQPVISPVRCPDPSCHWSVFGIPDAYTEARAQHLAQHQAEEHSPTQPEDTAGAQQPEPLSAASTVAPAPKGPQSRAAGAQQPEERRGRWEAAARAAGREVDRNALRAYMAVADVELRAQAFAMARQVGELACEISGLRAEVEQWQATFGRDALPDALGRLERAEADRDRLRAELGQARGATGQDTTVPADGEQETRQQLATAIEAARREWWMRSDSDTGQLPLCDVLPDAVLPVVQAAVAAGVRRALEDVADGLPDRLGAVLTERFTALGNPFSEMRRNYQGPDGWPASDPVSPNEVAEVLRELLSAEPAALPREQDGPTS